jgi:hypothetical protein
VSREELESVLAQVRERLGEPDYEKLVIDIALLSSAPAEWRTECLQVYGEG